MSAMGGDTITVLGAMVIGLGVGLACGIVNGVVVAVFRLQAIVATFATSIFFTGLALWVMPVAGTPAPAAFWRTYGGRILEIPFVFWAAVVLAVVLYLLARTRLAIQLLAVGDDAQGAYQSGLPVTAIRMRGYALCGLFAALGRVLHHRRHGQRRSAGGRQDDLVLGGRGGARRLGARRWPRHGWSVRCSVR